MSNFWCSFAVSIAPFVILLLLWFFLMNRMRKNNSQKTLIEPMRQVLQEDVVPEIRAIRESIDAITSELKARNEKREL